MTGDPDMEPLDGNGVHERGPAVLFWSLAAIFVFYSLGVRGLWGSEDRWAEIAREMRLTGDYFHPCLNGDPYFDKPLLGYWLILPVAAVADRLDEAVARLPSAIAGLVALGATISLARRLGSARQAHAAGWIFLSMWGFLFWARTAEADMENLAAIILAAAWYWARRDKPGFLSYAVFYVICFVGGQTKGLAAIAVPILVVLPDVLRAGRWRSYLSVSHVAALLLGLTVYLAPLVYAEMTRTTYNASGLYMAFKENIVRYFRPFDHEEPFYVYFRYVPQLAFPWIPLAMGAIWSAIATFKKSAWPRKWLTLSVLLVFLFFTISGSRRSYYILPILPFLAILTACVFDTEGGDRGSRLAFILQGGLLWGIAAFEILSPAVWPMLRSRIGFAASKDLMYVTALLGLLAALSLLAERRWPDLQSRLVGVGPSLGSLVVASAVMVGGYFGLQDGILDRNRTLKPFSLEIKERLGALGPVDIAFFGQCPPKTLFYLDQPRPIRTLCDADEVRNFLNPDETAKVVISRDRFLKDLVPVLPKEATAEPTLQEKKNPWERQKDAFVAWIIPAQTR
jgi:4-amino-4-deoxy-L-arabinose transferase-like glycosyltransferase